MLTANRPRIKDDSLYSMRQTAVILGVNPSTISRWVKAGRIKVHTRGLSNRLTFIGADILAAWSSIY